MNARVSMNINCFYTSASLDSQKHNVLDLSVRPSVRPFVCSSVTKLWTRYFEKWTDFNANWRNWSPRQVLATVKLGSQKVKGQRNRRSKLDLDAWWRNSRSHRVK